MWFGIITSSVTTSAGNGAAFTLGPLPFLAALAAFLAFLSAFLSAFASFAFLISINSGSKFSYQLNT